MNIVEKARALVIEKHAHLHRTSTSRQPMVEHIKEVVTMVSSATQDNDVIAAAWLHDTVEDTDITLEDIKAAFGTRIADIVDGLTDPPHFASMPTAERKAAQAKRILTKSADIKLIKICDQISNIKSVVNDTPPDWNNSQQWVYIEGAAKIAKLCSGLSNALDREFESTYLYAQNYYKGKL